MINNIVTNDIFLKINFEIPAKIRQIIIISIIDIRPNKKLDIVIPFKNPVNLRNKVIKSPPDIIPDIIFSFRSIDIIAGNGVACNWCKS